MPTDVAVRVLGPVEADAEGDGLDLMPALRTLLAALVVDAPRVVSADALQSRLWDDDAEGSTGTLHSYVSRLRQRLGREVLVTQAPGYRLALAADAVDAVRFRSLVRAAREEPDPALARPLVAEALGLWRGEAYADVPQRFARAEAARLDEQRLEARELAADLDLRLGRHREVAAELTALVGREPLREALRATLMVALYRCGRQAAALEVYEEGRHLLAETLGVDPGPALRRLHEQVLRQDPALDAPATATPVARAPEPSSAPAESSGIGRTALVEPPTALIGRERHVDDVVALLDGGARLVTLTGTGGVGKTRLALAVARRVRSRFADGAVLVPLATLTDPALVVPTLAHALGQSLGFTPVAGDPVALRDELVVQLGGRRLLLVLDNAEHLLDAAPDVSWLVASCPDLVVLVTSRAPLRVNGEEEQLVEPLAVTGDGAGPSSPAVSLFVTRARSVARGFRLDDGNAPAVTEICRRLGGIPLAIELAAARLRLLGPEGLLERLDEALASGPRDLPDRQRTMQATLDWSYRLLDDNAQRLFRTLAVFSGGFTLDLLQAVEGDDVVAPLEALVEHSLVGVTWSSERGPRYTVLEPTLQHARRLAAPDEHARAARAHALACVDLAERAAHGYTVAAQVRWLATVDDEHANLLAAFDRSVASGEHDVAGRIAWALWLYWWFRGHAVLGRRTATTAAALPGASPVVRTRATIAVAAMAFAQGDQAGAEEAWRTACEAAAALGDVEAHAHSEAGLGIVAITAGDLATARRHQRRAIELAEPLPASTDGPWIVAINHVWLGTALLEDGEREEALAHFRRGRALADERGDRLGAFVALWNLARAEAGTDDDAAHRHLQEGIRLSQQVADLANLSYFLDALVVTEVRRDGLRDGDPPRWARLIGAAETFRDRGHSQGYSGYYLPDEQARARAAGEVGEALGEAAYADHVRVGRTLSLDDAVALALR